MNMTNREPIGSATYSPEDNKLRLYPDERLSTELVERVKAQGFRWAPRQKLWVAAMWTPEREDLLLQLCGEILPEETSMEQRANDRAERYKQLSARREQEADQVAEHVRELADQVPFGQPILIGHHSEKKARKRAEKIDKGMERAVNLWKEVSYWKARAADVRHHVNYVNSPGVRHRRIKGLERELKRVEKQLAEKATWRQAWEEANDPERVKRLAYYSRMTVPVRGREIDPYLHQALEGGYITWQRARWVALAGLARRTRRQERWVEHYTNRLTFERELLNDQGGTVDQHHEIKVGGRVLVRGEWLVVLRVNKSGGRINSVTTTAPVNVRWTNSWKFGIEKVDEYRDPDPQEQAVVQRAMKPAPLCNYPGEGFQHMTTAEWNAKYRQNRTTHTLKATEEHGRHRVRFLYQGMAGKAYVFLTDAKRKDPPAPDGSPAQAPAAKTLPREFGAERMMRAPATLIDAEPEPDTKAEKFRAMEQQLKGGGTQVVVADQLFVTPAHVAQRMVEYADLEPGMTVLEPSAGTGALLAALPKDLELHVDAVELNVNLFRRLRDQGHQVVNMDFLEVPTRCYCPNSEHGHDRVIMNPPFRNGEDIKHIEHALDCLKDGGRLVAICANGPRQRAKLMPMATHWEDLPDGTFAQEGTNVRTALLVIDKDGPASDPAPEPSAAGSCGQPSMELF